MAAEPEQRGAPVAASGGIVNHDDLVARARSVLPPDVFAYFAGGSGEGITLAEQEAAWRSVRLRPRVLTDVSAVSTSVTLLGSPLQSPVLVAPVALHGLAHGDGEVATARGARHAGCLFVLSMRAGRRLEDVARVVGPFWQQIYVLGDRGVSDEIARRAADVGAAALVLTVDTPHVARKAAGFPAELPGTGLLAVLDDRDHNDARFQQAPDVTPADIDRLHRVSGLPVIAKGVLRGDQALRCIDGGAAAVVVSTHGGRQLDGVVAVPHALPEVADAVDGRAEVYADGGIRTGVDVLRALALGARAVLVGRPVIWALATDGAEGVETFLRELTAEVRDALALAGCTCVDDVGRDLAAQAGRMSQ
jgi:4-hydroxymandelate oxidase